MNPVDSPADKCGVGTALSRRFDCILGVLGISSDFPPSLFDAWRPVRVDNGTTGVSVVYVRLAENIRVVTGEKRNRFFRDSYGIIEQAVVKGVTSAQIDLNANDVLVRVEDNVAFTVKDVATNFGVTDLTLERSQVPLNLPTPGRGTIRMIVIGAKIG